MRTRHLCIGLVVGLVWTSAHGAQNVPTVAILADREAGLGLSSLVAILEARLSQGDGVRLLERAAIDKVLQEQQVSVAGLVERDAALKVGKLLRADAFVLLSLEDTPVAASTGSRAGDRPPNVLGVDESESMQSGQGAKPAGQLLRVRVAETAHGLRLWDGYEPLNGSEVEATAGRIAERVRAVVAKVGQPTGQVIPLGIVDIHRVQLPETYERLVRVLPGLLSACLGNEPRILMLERESLGILLRERQLTEGEDVAFWSSAVLIDGTLQPDPGKGVKVGLRLRRGSGEEISTFDIPIDANAPAVAVGKAAAEIGKGVLKVPLSTRWDGEREAEEFYRQGLLLSSHARWKGAGQVLEVAHALCPDRVFYTGALYRCEWLACIDRQGAVSDPRPNLLSDMELAELVSLLVRQVREGFRNGSLTAQEIWRNPCLDLGDGIGSREYFRSRFAMSDDQIRLINRSSRRIWIETLNDLWRQEQDRTGDAYPGTLTRCRLAWISSDDPEKRMAYLRKTFREFLMPVSLGGTLTNDDWRCGLCDQAFMNGAIRLRLAADDPIEAADPHFLGLWESYLGELADLDDPLVRFYALVTQMHMMLGASKRDVPNLVELADKAVAAVQDLMTGHKVSVNEAMTRRIAKQVGLILGNVSARDSEKAVDLWERVLTPLIQAGDAHALSTWFPLKEPVLGKAADRYSHLMEYAAAVLERGSGDPEVNRAYVYVRDYLERLWRETDAVITESLTSPVAVSMVVRRTDRPLLQTASAVASVREEMTVRQSPRRGGYVTQQAGSLLYVAFLFDYPSWIQESIVRLATIDLRGQRLVALQQVRLSPQVPFMFLSGMAVVDHSAFVAVCRVGIIHFQGVHMEGRGYPDQGPLLTEKEGLPSISITGLTGEGQRLWVAYGGQQEESGLGRYDPKKGHWEPVLCSTLKGEPPFNSGFPYSIQELTLAQDHRLFFFMYSNRTPGTAQAKGYYQGLWSLDTIGHQLTYYQMDGILARIVAKGDRVALCDAVSLVDLDPASREAVILLGRPRSMERLPNGEAVTAVEYRTSPFIPTAVLEKLALGNYRRSGVDLSTAAIHGDRLWARSGSSQVAIIPRGATQEQILTFHNNLLDGDEVIDFISTPYGLVAIGNGTVGLIEARDMPKGEKERVVNQ